MTLQERLQAILTPCWHDALTYGPKAPKGLLVLDAHDSGGIELMDWAYKFTVYEAEMIHPSLLDARDLSPLIKTHSISIGTEGPAVAYIITQDLSIKPVLPPKE